MTQRLSSETALAMAALAGHPVSTPDAERIAQAIGPAMTTFADIEGTLPFEAEPGRFMLVQLESVQAS